MKKKKLQWYDEELDYYFLVEVNTDSGIRYAYSPRALVHDRAFAKQFDTRRSARRCMNQGRWQDCRIVKVKRKHACDEDSFEEQN